MINLSKKKSNDTTIEAENVKRIGANLNFAALEAYKRLCVNLTFSFAGDSEGSHIIGVTSSLRGEGKSTTALNLAYSLAEMGKRTLIIDADMRLPNVNKLLEINQAPGLSNLLVGAHDGNGLIQHSGIHRNLYAIPAGDIPPNPTELLSSARMVNVLKSLAAKSDYIIVDLPPISAVADALIVSNIVDGMVLVVRENYADKGALSNAVRQLQFHKANILGFVLNCAEMEGHKYYGKYGKYSKQYYKK